ncbi:lysine--tRNA ligase, partial [Candidatus Peregrinibacteria bacterium CG10_big_fil_rev_8_21_14_0_10_54_7]
MDEFRLKKAETLRKKGTPPYAAKCDRTHTLEEGKGSKDGTKIRTAGRVMLFREMGGMIFATLQDHTGRLQVAWKADEIPEEEFKNVQEFVDLGDIIGISGERFTTKKGEPTILVKEWTMLSKALRQPPEKWHGIADQETAWRQRYLDLMSNRETYDRFLFRSLFLRRLREFYWAHDFIEVETPVLTNAASGALATPFVTHHKGYDLDVFLRIAAGETFQKECLVGGFDRTFEVARCFRNEGLDPSHLQDFTMVEHYAAYWDYEQNMAFTEEMLSIILKDLMGTTKLQIPNREGKLLAVDFKPPWPRASIAELIQRDCGIDIHSTATANALRAEIVKKKIRLEVDIASLERGNLIDQLYKKVSRPKIVQPTFLTNHPTDLSPLARLNDDDPAITDRFQLVVGGWEIVNA